jgi:sialidase-1
VSARRKAGELTANNPVAIADPAGGVVHFLYCVEYNRCFYTRSDDAGATFAPPAEITATFEKFRPEYDWKVLATGPGHGIRLKNGRLLVPVWLSTAAKGPHRPSCVATIYSDDGGKTWQRGDIVATPELVNPSETAAVQLVGGTVMLNIRHEGEPHHRAVVVGPDGAGGWGKVRFDAALPEPVCMASLVSLDGGGLLFCNPHNPSGRERKNLTVKRSDDGGATWRALRIVEPGASAYTDMAVIGADVLCLFEQKGTLTLARFTESWVAGER